MQRNSTLFLQAVVVLIGIVMLALLLWEPQVEGVNANATNFEIYLQDPFLALVYLGSIPFFVALFQTFKILGYIGQNKVFSDATIKALQTIKYCAIAIIGFVVIEEIFILLSNPAAGDDGPQAIVMGALITFGSIVVATTAGMFERIVESVVDINPRTN